RLLDGGQVGAAVKGVLLDEGQDMVAPGPLAAVRGAGGSGARRVPAALRESADLVVEAVEGDADLFEVVLALETHRDLADFLHRGQQQADQDGDDGDDHQELDQREANRGAPGTASCHVRSLRASSSN